MNEITEHIFYSPFHHIDKFTGTKAEYDAHFADLMKRRKESDRPMYDMELLK